MGYNEGNNDQDMLAIEQIYGTGEISSSRDREIKVMRENAAKYGYPQPRLVITGFGGYRYLRAVCPDCAHQPLIRGYNQHYSRQHAHPETVKRGDQHPNRVKAVLKQQKTLEGFEDVDFVGEPQDWKRRSDAAMQRILAKQREQGRGVNYA